MNTASWIVVLLLVVVVAAALWRMRRDGTGCGECKKCGSASSCATFLAKRNGKGSSKSAGAVQKTSACGCAKVTEKPVVFRSKADVK